MRQMTTVEKGQIAMLRVQLRAAEKGMVVSIPTTPARYDLVIDDGKRLWRAQVKYGNGKASGSTGVCVVGLIRATYSNKTTIKFRTYQSDEIDVVLAYLPAIDRVLWLGPDVFSGRRSVLLRLQPTKNKQPGGRRAADFVW